MTRILLTGTVLGAALIAAQPGLANNHKNGAGMSRIEQEVRRELIMLPFYSLFDHFAFKVDGETVTLMGKVSRPTLKRDAERVVARVEGVEKVSNQIEILPVSTNDDRLRMALYRSIYGHASLQTLAVRAMPPIHIVVENGNVTLEGVVATELQKTMAGAQANTVPGVFSVTNNLRLETTT